mgnify:CR=1 FL=1
MKFEEAIEKLQKITEELEQGELPLEETLQKFEEGTKLIDFCEKKLNETEKKIKVLMKDEDKLVLKDWEKENPEKDSLTLK